MKAQILKIAGVKTEAEFYKKFPSEEAFMKKHGKELKKAQTGTWIPGVGFSSDVQAISNAITKKNNKNIALGTLANSAGSIVGLSQSIADKYGRQSKQLDQYGQVAALANKAATSAPQPQKNKYVRPEDQMVQPINPLGVQGFGYFEDGGEIQNTFAPNDIYTDMGYEPLTDSNPKQYFGGGVIADTANAAGKATGGFDASQFTSAAGSLGGGLGSLAGGSDFEQTDESQLLSTILGVAGTAIGGPVGGLAGAGIGGLVGGAIGGGKKQEMKMKRNLIASETAGSAFAANLRNGPFNAIGKNGISVQEAGYMNPNYNPQVIAKFGDYDVDQLFTPPHDADMLRAGGHLKEYTPPSAAAMYTGRDLPYQMEDGGQMAMGGDLKVLDGGYAETISYNPYMPGTGETVMFRGRSHDNGGIPIQYGQNGVEVEGGEPMFQMEDGGEMNNPSESNTSGLVAGNLIIPGYGAEEIGDEKAKGKKFKHYITDLSKVEAKQNKTIGKTISFVNEVNGDGPFDQLTLNSGQANLIGANMKLKDIANKKMNAAAIQNAILDTAKEHGLESDALAKGKIKYAKANDPYAEFGTKLKKFEPGGKASKTSQQINPNILNNLDSLYKTAVKTKDPMAIGKFQKAALDIFGADEIKKITGSKNITKKSIVDGKFGPATSAIGKAVAQKMYGIVEPKSAIDPNAVYQLPSTEQPQEQRTTVPEWMPAESRVFTPGMSDAEMAASKQSGKNKPEQNSPWETAATFANSLIPYMSPSNQMELEPVQLAPEMYALSDNTLDPVYAQTYQPNYTQPVSISYQDQLNANQADFNAMQRQLAYNPEALSVLAGQKYGANSKVLGEQFRVNQAEQQRARETNRETANDAQLKNMAIFQDQATKMAQTKSNLKQQKQVALSSIADKIAKNKLENRQLGIAENLYKYRYTPNGVAYNVNGLANFAPYGSGYGGKGGAGQLKPGKKFSYDENQQIIGTYNSDDKEDVKVRNGKKVNGSIVKAIKNL